MVYDHGLNQETFGDSHSVSVGPVRVRRRLRKPRSCECPVVCSIFSGAALAAGLWSVLMSRASKLVHPIVGTGLIEGTAIVLVLILLLRNRVDLGAA